jgi:S-methylmethionine-dependent homocysteine/selenocysteine methylase
MARLAQQTEASLTEEAEHLLGETISSVQDQQALTELLERLDELALCSMQVKEAVRRHLHESRRTSSQHITPDTRRWNRSTRTA